MNILPAPYSGASAVGVKIFTLAFRLVVEADFQQVPSGTAVAVNLTSRWGTPLADGLYYVVVTTHGGKNTGKLLVLR